MFFWSNQEWLNAFIFQGLTIIAALKYGNYLRLNTHSKLLIVFLLSPVPFMKFAAGTIGSVFFIDIFSCLTLFNIIRKRHLLFNWYLIVTLALFLVLPILVTLTAYIWNYNRVEFYFPDFIIQSFRYMSYFIIGVYFLSNKYIQNQFLQTELRLQFFIISTYSVLILLAYIFNWPFDAWNSLLEENLFTNKIGGGSLYMYRATIGFFLSYGSLLCLYFLFRAGTVYSFIFLLLIYLVMGSGIVLSGSRQGLFVFILVFLAYFSTHFKFKYLLLALVISFIVLSGIKFLAEYLELDKWTLERYSIVTKNSDLLNDEIADRNADISQYNFLGAGLGGRINSTESDYINTFLYFGIGGILLYLYFIFATVARAVNKLSKSIINENEGIIVPIVFIFIFPLFGIQQWFIMTTGAHNSVMAYIALISFARMYK